MSLVLNVEILGEFKNLTAATKGAQSQLTQMNKRAQSVSKAITGAFAAIGVGFSLRIITQQLEEAAKAAIEDSKSMDILALAMENTGKATKDQVAQAEKAIKRMQFQSAVADDELRPAYQKLYIATKSVTDSNRLLQIALDASAATGKSLDAVSQAMAKSLAGSDTALVKLIPSLKGAKDPMAELEKTFKGAAEEAANLDPYKKMEIIFGEMQEQIGMSLLPTLEKFSDWLSTPEGQEKFQKIVDGITKVLEEFGKLAAWAIDNEETVLGIGIAIGGIATAIKTLEIVSKLNAGPINTNFVKMFGWVGLAISAVEAVKWLNENLDFSKFNIDAAGGQQGALNFSGQSGAAPSAGGSNMTFTPPKPAAKKPTVVQNIRITGTQSPQQIANTLNKGSFYSGTQLLRGGR